MKMSSIFKKASVFAIAVTMVLLMVISVLPAVFAADATESTGFGEKLAATNISVAGGITMQYYFTGVDDAEEVLVTYPMQNGDLVTRTYAKSDLDKDSKGRYLVEIPIAFAQQTETLTIQWKKDGALGKKFEKKARDYADLIFKYAELDLSNPKYSSYGEVKANAQAMVPMVTYMLNAGAQAQIANNYKVGELEPANKGLFAADTNPIDNMLADHFYDVDKRTEHDTTGTGVTFTGTQLFLKSKVNLRVYLTCPDSVTTAKVYKGEQSQEVYIKTETTGGVTRKYVGINNIVPTDFNTRFLVEIGDAKFEYSVLDYAYNAVESPFATQEMKDTAKSLYLFYTYTREYTAPKDEETGKPTYVVGPKEKDDEGKIVVNEATGMPQAATKVDESGNTVVACDHTRAYSNGSTIVCPDCGYTYEKEIIQIIASAIKSEGIEQGKNTGKLTISYAIAGNTEFTGLLIAPNLPEGINWSVDSVKFFDGIEGEIMRNCEIDTTVPFSTGKIVEVTYLIDATNATAGANQITFRLVQATDSNGELVSDETLAGVLTTTVHFDVLPQKCADGAHTFKYSIDTNCHYQICSTCYESVKEAHSYTTNTEKIGNKVVYSYGACVCGAVQEGGRSYTYDLGFTLDAEGNKVEKAPLLVFTPSDIKKMSTTRVDKGDITTDADGSYITLHDSATSGEGYINFFSGNNKYGVTGQYLMIKYRTTHAKNTQIFFGANNGHTGAYGGDNFYLTPGSKSLVANGEWQTLILDLNKIGEAYFKAETEGENTGKFMADYIRWDVFDTNPTGSEQSVDVAYIAMSDDIMSLASFAGNDIYTACTTSGTVGSLFCAIGSYMASTKTLNPFFNASWIDQSYNNFAEVNINEAVDTANGGLHYAEITRASSSTATDRYMFLMGSSNPGASKIIAPTTSNAKYAAIMYRKHVDTGSSKRFQLLLHSTSTGMDGKGTVNFTTNYHVDGDWHLTIADLSVASVYDPTVGIKSIRFDYHDAGIADGDTNLTDIAFVAFFSSEEEAHEYMREYTQKYLTVEGGQGCTHDEVSPEWVYVENNRNDRFAVEGQLCAYCDEVVNTREAVISVNFDNFLVATEDGTESRYSWGSRGTPVTDPTKRHFGLYSSASTSGDGLSGTKYSAPTFLRSSGAIGGSGWAGINGLFTETSYYRILDKDGNVLLDWTAIANSRGGALASNNGVVTTAKGQLESCGIETDPRRFNMGTIDLSNYANLYGQGDPISLEYALQAEDAPEGSDLILAVRIENIYTNCTNHTFEIVYEDNDGVRTGYNKCTNCGFVKGSHSITLGNKAPNLFMGAQDIAGRLSSATNMSKTGVLSDDGSYVTISNTANKSDGYFNLLNGNKTVTGRYMVIKYRTTYDGTWQFYTSSNSATPSAGQTSGDGFCLYTYRADSITGGVINDGNWNYAIFDLAGLNPNAFKAYEDGSYMAQFFRWDIFDSSRESATVDVAFVAFSDDLKALTGMDNIVTYDYAFAKSSTTAAVLPMSNTVGDNNPFFDAISLAGKGSAKSGTLLTDEANGNMPYAQFTATSTSEQYFMLWNNTGYMLSGSGKYVGILYRSPKASQMEIFVNSTAGSAQGGCNKQEGITADNEWHFIYVDVSKFKSGSHYYDESKGLGSFRFDLMNAGHAAGSTIDVAFVGFFDGADDMTATLSAYYDMYGIQVDTTAIGVKSPETSINANDSFSVTVSGVKGAFTSGTITLSGIPTDAVVESYVLGAGVTGTIDGTTITITAIDNTVFDGTIATLTFKTTYKTAGGDYTVGVTTNIVNGEGKVTAKFSGTTAITVVAHECTFGAYEFTSTQHYQTCTVCGEVVSEDHTIGNTTATEIDGVMNYVTGCTVCEWNFSKLTADATKAPLVVYSAKQIHSVLKANTAQHGFFQGFELIQDENGAGFVRITSNGSNGDPYAYIYKPSTVTETGRYLTIRYRIPASNSGNTTMLQIFASTTNGGMNGADTSGNIFPVAKQSDNEWRTLVIDLTQNGTTYTAADGKYSAKYVRLDFFGNAGNQDGDYVDIQFIAFSDKLNTNVSDGVTKFSENTSYYSKDTTSIHDFDQFNGLMSWLGDEKLGGQNIVTEPNGLTYNKFISKSGSEQTLTIYTNATTLKHVSDYIAIIYRAPKQTMVNGSLVNNGVGYGQIYVHSTATGAQGSCDKSGAYSMSGEWKVMILDFSSITTAYDPATGLSSLRLDFFNTSNEHPLKKGAELHIAAIGFVENAAAGTAWYNEFLKAYYPEGQTAYVPSESCAHGAHTDLDGWVPATADDGTLKEQKICFSCGAVMEERNVWYRGWINGVYYNGTADANKVTSSGVNAYYNNAASSLESITTAATTVALKGWFATNGGTSAYYYRVNGGEWIKITDCSLAAANSGITSDVDKQGMGIKNYSGNALFNGYISTGDLTTNYAGQPITIEFGACPTNNPGTEDAPNVISFKTFTNVQIAG